MMEIGDEEAWRETEEDALVVDDDNDDDNDDLLIHISFIIYYI